MSNDVQVWQKPAELLGPQPEEDEGPFDTPEQKLEGFRKLLERKGVNSRCAGAAGQNFPNFRLKLYKFDGISFHLLVAGHCPRVAVLGFSLLCMPVRAECLLESQDRAIDVLWGEIARSVWATCQKEFADEKLFNLLETNGERKQVRGQETEQRSFLYVRRCASRLPETSTTAEG